MIVILGFLNFRFFLTSYLIFWSSVVFSLCFRSPSPISCGSGGSIPITPSNVHFCPKIFRYFFFCLHWSTSRVSWSQRFENFPKENKIANYKKCKFPKKLPTSKRFSTPDLMTGYSNGWFFNFFTTAVSTSKFIWRKFSKNLGVSFYTSSRPDESFVILTVTLFWQLLLCWDVLFWLVNQSAIAHEIYF